MDYDELGNTKGPNNDQTQLVKPHTDSEVDNNKHRDEEKITHSQCLSVLLRSNITTGILAMPLTIKYAGLWTGFFGILLLIWLTVYCMHLLIKACKTVCNRVNTDTLDYGSTMECAVTIYLNSTKLAKVAKTTVNILLCVAHLGWCTIYMLFISVNMKQFIEFFTQWQVPVIIYQSVILLFLVPYCCIKSLKSLSVFCIIGNLFMFTTLIIVIQYCVRGLTPVTELPGFTDIQSMLPFVGTASFSISSIGLILPLRNKLHNSDSFTQWNGVLNTSMALISVAFLTIGFFAYLRFGLDTEPPLQGSLALNMPNDHWLYICIKLTLSTAVFMSYGVHFYVPMHIVLPLLDDVIHTRYSPHLHRTIRVCLVLMTYMFITLIPKIELVISVLTTLAGGCVTLVVPPLLDIVVNSSENKHLVKLKLCKNLGIILFSTIAIFVGIITAINGTKETYRVT